MFRWAYHWKEAVAGLTQAGCGLLFPPRCASCEVDLVEDRERSLLCGECLAKLGPETWPSCRRCGGMVNMVGCQPAHCPLCKNAPLHFDSAVTLGGYHAGLRAVILCMKRPSHDALSTAMGRLLALRRRCELENIRADVVVPIPMFWTRRLRRGTNNPELLAVCLGSALNIPVQRRLLVRCRNTLPQVGLPPLRRFNNMRGAFRVRRGADIENARILLVDDVLTTGATCSEAAKMLKQAGASMVAVAVVARAQGKDVVI